MGKNTGFLEFDRAVNAAVPPRERVGSFDEFAAFAAALPDLTR